MEDGRPFREIKSMKVFSVFLLFYFLVSVTLADDRPTIDSLIGKKICIEDAFAGQSFTLQKEKKNYFVKWIRHGSGVSEIRSQKCKVQLDSNYQYCFSLDHPEEFKHQFMVSIRAKEEIKVYVNGIRIHFEL